MSLKILIADDHALLRQGLRQLLGDESPDYEFVEADGFNAALAALAEYQADLLLIDLGMPDMSGAESLRQLRATHPTRKSRYSRVRMTGQRFFIVCTPACMATL